MKRAAVLTAILLLVILSGCTTGSKVRINGNNIYVEVADDMQARALGLMYRGELEKDSGMLFMFNDENERTFWMKNTIIPLDMIFIDKDKKIINTITAVPCTKDPCPSYSSSKPAQYVLEVNGGYAQNKGIELGDSVQMFVRSKNKENNINGMMPQ